jgi:alpha-tubulin suppressor-like RCC1 family protein
MKTGRNPIQIGLLCAALAAAIPGEAQTVTNVAGRGLDSLFIKSDGSLWVMGQNLDGMLGDGTLNNTNTPQQIVSNGVVAIAGGLFAHNLFIKSDGSLWAMGYNFYGQLGDGTSSNTNRPERIITNGVVAVAAGGGHSLFIKSDGSLWAMGANYEGQLGNGTYNNTNTPQLIVSNGVVAAAAGGTHSLFIKSDGSLWAMGQNSIGQLGDGTFNTTNLPEQIVSNGVVTVVAGNTHTLFIKSDGSLWGMGNNLVGELGDGTFNSTNRPEQIISNGVVTVTAGPVHSLFIKSDGSLWAMGNNLYGELGDGTVNFASPTGTNTPQLIVSNGVVAVAGGENHSLFARSDGSLWAMGRDAEGELGDGFNGSIAVPEQILPLQQPTWTRMSISSKTNLLLTATCRFGSIYYVFASTNLTLPLNQWTPVATNLVRESGSANFICLLLNGFNPAVGQQYYILRSQ